MNLSAPGKRIQKSEFEASPAAFGVAESRYKFALTPNPSPAGYRVHTSPRHFVWVGFSPLDPPKLGDFEPEQWR